MMSNHSTPLLAVLGILVVTVGPCLAQPPAAITQPTVSPYLNLTRRGASPAINYYNLVRPQTQLYNSVQQLQQQVGTNQQDIAGLQPQSLTTLPSTGHPVGFMNHGQYFMTMGQSGASARPGQAIGGSQPRPLAASQGGAPSPRGR